MTPKFSQKAREGERGRGCLRKRESVRTGTVGSLKQRERAGWARKRDLFAVVLTVALAYSRQENQHLLKNHSSA